MLFYSSLNYSSHTRTLKFDHNFTDVQIMVSIIKSSIILVDFFRDLHRILAWGDLHKTIDGEIAFV
jgi:hypothetical protein